MAGPSFARRHRATLAAVTVVVVAAAALVAYAVTRPGYTVRHEDLNDGGVWVTTDSDGLFGRLNKPIGQLDAGFYPPGGAQAAYTIDIVQDGSTVLAWDKGSGKLYPVDVRTGVPTASQAAAVAGDARVELAGGTAAVLDPATGKLWAARMSDGDTSTVPKLDSGGKPRLTAGAGADLAVGRDGTVYVASAATSRLFTLQPTANGFGKPVIQKLDRKSQTLRLTAVGDQPVVLGVDTATVIVPGGRDVQLPAADASPNAVLQQPGPAAPDVLIATPTTWLSVPLSGNAPPATLFSRGSGKPARPVRLGACEHAAWGGAPGVYARTCSGSKVSAQKIPGDGKISQPVFRVNHDQLVLNDLASGGVWIVDDTVREVDNWSSVRPPKPKPKNDKPTKPQKNVHPAAQDRPPVPKPDHLGARPGRTTVLHVLDNDADPDGDILTVTAVTDLSDKSSPVSIAADGQTVQIALAPDARSDVTFHYTVSDGKGQSASTDVSVTPRTGDQNDAPTLRYGYQAKTWSVAAGGTFSYPVLSDWRDFDGDPLALVAASTRSGTVSTTDDGSIVFTAPQTTGTATVPVTYQVSDGIAAPVSGTLTVTVHGANATGAVPATAEPDVARAVVGGPITINPLANDIPGSDPTDPSARLAIAAPVAQPVGATVSTDLTDGTVTVTAKHPGTLLLKYQAAFGSAKLSTGVIRVDAVADPDHPLPPVAMPDTAVLRGQQASVVDVLANDYDPSGNVLVVQRAEPADDNSGLQIAVIQGRWLRISSNAASSGGVQIVNYTITDGVTDPVTGQVAVVQLPAPHDPAPPVPTDDSATVRAGDYVDVPVLDNDFDPNGQPLHLKAARSGDLGEGRLKVTPALGDAYVSGGIVRYEAPPTVSAPTDVLVDYVVADESGLSAVGHVRLSVTPLPTSASKDQPPNPQAVQRSLVAGDTLKVTIPSTGVDPDGDSVSIVGLASAPKLGRVTAIGPTTLTYESYPLAFGTDTFAYTVTDRYGLTGTAQIRIGVVPPGDPQPPVAVDDRVTAAPGAVVRVPVLANDYVATDDDVSIQPLDTTNDGVPPGTSLADDRVVVTAPPATGKPLIVSYAILGGTGARSVAQVIVDSQPHYDNPPEARDDVAKVAPGARTTTVDALANDDDPDGNSTDLKISHVYTAGATVDGGKVTVPVRPYAQAVGYQVTDKGGASALAIIHVPGSGGKLPGLRPDVAPIHMAADSSKTVRVADYVVDPAGKQLHLTTTNRIWASPAGKLTAGSDSDSALTLTAHGGYVGPAAVIFEVTNGELSDPAAQKVIVSVPVEIGTAQPVLRCPDAPLTAIQGGTPLKVDLLTVCHVWLENSGGLGAVDFAATWGKAVGGVTLAKAGNSKLTITPTAQAHAGTSGTITVSVPGTSAKDTLNVRVVAAPPPTVAPITVRGLKAGQSQTVDVRQYVQTPIAGATVSVVSTNPPSISGVSLSASGPRLTLSAAPGNTHGTMTFSIIVTDVAGPGHDDRHVAGSVTVEVLGLPGTPGQPSVLQTLSHTALVAFTTPPANGAPIDQIQVVNSAGGTHDCPASPCTVNGLKNGAPVRFQVRAHNVVGWSQPSPWSAATTPDALPNGVTGVTAKPGDQSAAVRWAPGTVDGSPITTYQVQISPAPDNGPGIVAVAAPGTAATPTGLTNGVTYSFRVRAQNRKGWGPWSTSASTVPFGTPVAPAAPAAQGITAAKPSSSDPIQVSWNPPSDNGNGRPIVSYTVTPYRNGAAQAPVQVGTATSWTKTVPTDGAKWQFAVTATNSGGKTSPSSPKSTPAIVASTVPDKMSAPTAKVKDGAPNTAYLTYRLPSTNGSAIKNIKVTDNHGNSYTCGTAGSCTIKGLTDGDNYAFHAQAVNDNGPGPQSAASNGVTPYMSPAPKPTANATKSGSQGVHFTWSTPNVDKTISCKVTYTGGSSTKCNGSANMSPTGYEKTGTVKITVTAVDMQGSSGKTRSASDSATTDNKPPPKNPSASVAWGAYHTSPTCTSQYCHYVKINIKDFKANATVSGSYNAEQHGWSTSESFSIRTNGSGDGSWTSSGRYFGYPGVIIDIKINGKTYKSPWPSS